MQVSASIIEQERKQSQTQMISFEVRTPRSTPPPSPREGFTLPTKDFFTNEPPQRNYNGLHKTEVHNSNSK